jgi:hypothetical protein
MREVGRKTLGPSLRLGLAETIWSEVIWALPPHVAASAARTARAATARAIR